MNRINQKCDLDVETDFSNDKVKMSEEIDWHDIEKVANGKLLAIRVPNFYQKTLCEQVVIPLLNHKCIDSYAVAPDIFKLGKSTFDLADHPELFVDHYEHTLRDLKQIRSLFFPNVSPIDLLRVNLQELWPAGSNLENYHGKTVFSGLFRMFKSGSEALPHQDMSHWDVPEAPAVWTQQTQLAANVYLKLPKKGGALELWDVGFKTQSEYNCHQLPNSYGIDRRKIPSSAAVIYPEQGELIIFDARRIHAVQKIEEGVRLTSSCFIAYRGVTQPLAIYS